MKRYKIYIPAKSSINPFISELVKALEQQRDVREVLSGLDKFKNQESDFDVVIFQWPEVLFGWKTPENNDILFLESVIKLWKQKGISLLATIHNIKPHMNNNLHMERLYNIVYSNCDRLIHLGEASKIILNATVKHLIPREHEFVIPHGNYNCFKKYKLNESITSKLKKCNGPRILVLGHIRNKAEVDLILTFAKAVKSFNGELLVAGILKGVTQNKKKISYYKSRLPLWLTDNLKFKEGFVPNEMIATYMNVSDILLIPRINSINSGNVALGFTFGKIVIGPDYGVIGEELRKLNNSVFDIENDFYAENTINHALSLLKNNNVAHNNLKYANEVLDWNRLGAEYIDLIKTIEL